MVNYVFFDSLMVLGPTLLGILLGYFMLKRSYKRALEIGFSRVEEKEKKLMLGILLGFSAPALIYAIVEWILLMNQIGIFDGTFEEERLTPLMDLASNLAAVGGFLVSAGIGLAAVKRNRIENEILAARLSKPNVDEIIASRDPRNFRRMIIKMIFLLLAGALILRGFYWLITVDTSMWDEELKVLNSVIL